MGQICVVKIRGKSTQSFLTKSSGHPYNFYVPQVGAVGYGIQFSLKFLFVTRDGHTGAAGILYVVEYMRPTDYLPN
jgi:hypothetical protein